MEYTRQDLNKRKNSATLPALKKPEFNLFFLISLVSIACTIFSGLGKASATVIDFNISSAGECLGLGTSFSINSFNFSTVAPGQIAMCSGSPISNGLRFANNGTNALAFLNTGSVGNEGIAFTLSRLDGSAFDLIGFDFAEMFKLGDSAFLGNATQVVVRGFNGTTEVTSTTFYFDGLNDGPGGGADFETIALPQAFNNLTSVTFTSSNSINTGTFATNANWLIDNLVLNQKPTATACCDTVIGEGSAYQLIGSGSDPDGDSLGYVWSQLAGPSVALLPDIHTSNPIFTAPLVELAGETLTFQLIVGDGQLTSEPDIVNITVTNLNNLPVADAGEDQTVAEGSGVGLSGANSYDPDGESLQFSWVQTAGPTVSLIAPNSAGPKFFAPLVGASGVTLTFELTVSDGIDTSKDTVSVFVENVNHHPVADAGPDQTKDEGTVVTLDATASGDPDGDQLDYIWSQVLGPTVVLSNANSATPTFTAPLVNAGGAMLRFRLRVFDGELNSLNIDEVDIRVVDVNDPPLCGLAQPSISILWPPTHKLVPIWITNVTDPNSNQVSVTVTSVTQDEPVNGLGDGDTSPDAVLQGDRVLLRVERAGYGNGRVYKVNFTANDGQGGACNGSVLVSVHRDMKPGNLAINDGQLYNSTLP